jgi:glyoxylase-like metal-dependent hydrolase (beta-lactamase superfamily II)
MTAPWTIHAVRYAEHPERQARENFLGADPHDGPMPMDYFVWVLTGHGRTIVVDTGFDAATATRRGRRHLRSPADGLRLVGIEPDRVGEVIVTHMHFDHVGNHDLFPGAIYHVQDRELAFVTGRLMGHRALRHAFEEEDVVAMVRRVFRGAVRFHDGDDEIAPGVTVHLLGGHTAGMQVVRVWTRRGWVVLASDATHYYANFREGRPFPFLLDLGRMLEGHATLRRLADSDDHVVPGHDPLVTRRYPPAAPGLAGAVVRLDADPAPAP